MTCRSGSTPDDWNSVRKGRGRVCVTAQGRAGSARWKERHQRLQGAWVFPEELFAAAGALKESCGRARPQGVRGDGEEWDRDCSVVLGHRVLET